MTFLSIALKKPRVRIPPDPLANPQVWGIVLFLPIYRDIDLWNELEG
jgi:hypothetical protein